MKRLHKGQRVSRYLAAHTGVPSLAYDPDTGTLTTPPPLHITVITARSWWRFVYAVEHAPEGLSATIRFDADIPSIDEAIVGMRLRDYATLLTAYLEKNGDKNAPSH